MIPIEKQKAIIEGMLFANSQPVPLSKMVRKIRQVIKKESIKTDEVGAREELRAKIDKIRRAAEALQKDEIPLALDEETHAEEDMELSDQEEGEEIKDQLVKKQEELDLEVTNNDIKSILKDIQENLEKDDRGIELVTVAKGYQLRTKFFISEYLKDEKIDAPVRLTPSSLETLAIVAYEQPVTRQRIEEIRGIDSGGVLKTLLEKGFLKVIGRSDEPGRPLVYGSSKKFLEVFSLNSLKDLPSLQDYYSLQISSDDDEIAEEAKQEIEDLVDEEVWELTEAEKSILHDLDSSLENLKSVEKEIEMIGKQEDPGESSDPEDPINE